MKSRKIANQVKYILIVSIFLLVAITNAFTQTKNQIAIANVLATQQTAWNNGNIDAFMQGYWHSDSLMFIGKSGVTYGWLNTLNNYKKGYPDTAAMGKLSFEIIQMKRLSVMYYSVVGKWFLKRSIGDIGGAFTLILRKIKGKWVIIQDHSS